MYIFLILKVGQIMLRKINFYKMLIFSVLNKKPFGLKKVKYQGFTSCFITINLKFALRPIVVII